MTTPFYIVWLLRPQDHFTYTMQYFPLNDQGTSTVFDFADQQNQNMDALYFYGNYVVGEQVALGVGASLRLTDIHQKKTEITLTQDPDIYVVQLKDVIDATQESEATRIVNTRKLRYNTMINYQIQTFEIQSSLATYLDSTIEALTNFALAVENVPASNNFITDIRAWCLKKGSNLLNTQSSSNLGLDLSDTTLFPRDNSTPLSQAIVFWIEYSESSSSTNSSQQNSYTVYDSVYGANRSLTLNLS